MTSAGEEAGPLVFDDDPSLDFGGRFQILALSGGGYRGLYTAILLEELEKRAGRPLRECFDLIAGTSIGGILALGLGAGVPAEHIRKAFNQYGDRIFPHHFHLLGIKLPRPTFAPLFHRFSNSGLKHAIAAILKDKQAKSALSSLPLPVLITAVNSISKDAEIFGHSSQSLDPTLLDAALATSAAPTYFPEHKIGTRNYVDGGLVANAPDLIAINEALRSGHRREDIHVLSLGTIEENTAEPSRPAKGTGWLNGAKSLFELTLSSQQELAISEAKKLLSRRYLRLDAIASKAQMKELGLADVNVIATETLAALAGTTIEDQIGDNAAQLRSILNFKAEWTNSLPDAKG